MNHFLCLRKTLKHYLPAPIRVVIRAVFTYAQRIGRWVIILIQIRGATFTDQLKLLVSALAAPFISLHSITHWQDPHLLFDIDVIVFGIGQFSLRGHTDDLWHVLPWRERAVIKIIRSHLKHGDVFIDAGANIGFYSIVASKLIGPNGKIFAIEMIQETVEILTKHCEINSCDNVTIVNYALSDCSHRTVMAQLPVNKFGQASISSILRKGELHEKQVITSTLDEILADVKNIKLIKMDIEGEEFNAVQGAQLVLHKVRAIIFECWDPQGDDLKNISSKLDEFGFSITRIDNRNILARRQ